MSRILGNSTATARSSWFFRVCERLEILLARFAVLGVAVGIGVAIYAYGRSVTETYRTIRENPPSKTAD